MISKRDQYQLYFVAAVIFLLFSPAVVSGAIPFLRDLTYLFHPWKTFGTELIRKGEMPLWNPYAACGMPFLANWQTAVFYPFSILFYFFGYSFALAAFHYLHLFLAGLFAYVFARSLGLARWPSSGMALLFAMNGYLVTRLEFLSHIGTDIWTFALFLFAGRPVLFAVVISFAFFAGHPAFFIQLAMGILYWMLTGNGAAAPRARGTVTALILALVVSGCQLLPTLELVSLASRSKEGLAAAVAMTLSLAPHDLLRLITPLFPSSVAPIAGERFPWATTFHVGILGTLAAIAGMFARASLRKSFAIIMIAVGALLSLGNSTPVYPWLYAHFPFLQGIRYPAQFIIVSVAGTVLLSGAGLQSLRCRSALVMLIAAELLALSWNFQATAKRDFYAVKPSSAAFLQRHLGHARFIVSPGAEADRHFGGNTVAEAWQRARGYLYHLTGTPYHLRNAYGLGEPLVPHVLAKAVDTAYRQKTPQDALPYFRNLGVRYLIAREPLKDARGFRLMNAAPPLLYELDEPGALYESPDGAGTVASVTFPGNGRVRFSVDATGDAEVVWRETAYPGWDLYIDGKREHFAPADDVFRRWRSEAGKSSVIMVYRPAFFYFGIMMTVLGIALLVSIGYRGLMRFRVRSPA